MKKLLFIYNPRAGMERIRSNLLDIIDVFTKAGYTVTAYPTQGQGDAERAVMEMEEKYELIVCSGGDGTLDEVVSGLLRAGRNDLPLGYVPAGSTNDFAASLGIPSGMRAAAQVVMNGTPRACDVGFINGKSFIYVVAFGVFTDVSYETRQDLKNLLGHMAYLLEGARKLSEIRSWEMTIKGDETELSGEFLYGMVTNSNSVGGFKGITGGNVDLSDGVFEVTLIRKPPDVMEMGGILAALANRSIHSDYVINFKTRRLELISTDEVSWTRDGEYGGSFREVVIENHREVLKILVQKSS